MSFIFVKRFCKKIVEMTNKIWQKVYRKAVKSIVEHNGVGGHNGSSRRGYSNIVCAIGEKKTLNNSIGALLTRLLTE